MVTIVVIIVVAAAAGFNSCKPDFAGEEVGELARTGTRATHEQDVKHDKGDMRNKHAMPQGINMR